VGSWEAHRGRQQFSRTLDFHLKAQILSLATNPVGLFLEVIALVC